MKFISPFKAANRVENFSIGITTFERRFDRYFVPLVEQICAIEAEVEIIIAVNGEHRDRFSETFRSAMLGFAASQPGIFPIFFPQFRGLSKLWNSIIIHSTHDHVLMLNDDVSITKKNFLEKVRNALDKNKGRTFTINGSWSHFVINKEEIDSLGYFDERLLGIGEEDGDISWRYLSQFGRAVSNFSIPGIENHSEETMSEKPVNISCHSGGKYSRFNRQFIYEQKYRKDPDGIKAMFDSPMVLESPGVDQYPHEQFFRANRSKL